MSRASGHPLGPSSRWSHPWLTAASSAADVLYPAAPPQHAHRPRHTRPPAPEESHAAQEQQARQIPHGVRAEPPVQYSGQGGLRSGGPGGARGLLRGAAESLRLGFAAKFAGCSPAAEHCDAIQRLEQPNACTCSSTLASVERCRTHPIFNMFRNAAPEKMNA